jgi:hypothetical protein
MSSYGFLSRVALVRIDVSEERSASVIRVTRIGELGISLAVTRNQRKRLTAVSRAQTRKDTERRRATDRGKRIQEANIDNRE